MSQSPSKTFADFFRTPSVEEIKELQADAANKLAAAEPHLKAVESSDADVRRAAYRELANLGYAQKVDGEREGTYYWELKTWKIENDQEYVKMTPEQIQRRSDLILNN